jgi:hypothetical protein
MTVMRNPLLLAAVFASCLAPAAAGALPQGAKVAVVDFEYSDTSGEAADQAAAHERRLSVFMQALRADLAAKGANAVVQPVCAPEPCETGRTPPAELKRAAGAAGASIIVVGAIHKESTLVQWMKTTVVDLGSDAVVFDKLLTFRGDNDEAWRRAEIYLIDNIAGGAAAPGSAKIKLAVFPFELEDFSGGASLIPPDDVDREQLRLSTETARRLIADSGRYELVDVTGAKGEAVEAHKLHDCNGCDVPIAAGLGADQSLVGVVTRISRTDYAVTYKLRDAHTGATLAVQQTDLRIGANYSWSKGAKWLIERKLLAPAGGP